jgi:hypothetical protein
MTAQGYFDADGRQVEASQLVGVGPDGAPLPLIGSTLGVPQALEGPVDARELLDLAVSGVYLLGVESLDAGLAGELAAGHVFRTPFNYRPDYRIETAYLLKNDAGYFALVGVPAPAAWLSPDAPPPVEAADDAGDALDFEMF